MEIDEYVEAEIQVSNWGHLKNTSVAHHFTKTNEIYHSACGLWHTRVDPTFYLSLESSPWGPCSHCLTATNTYFDDAGKSFDKLKRNQQRAILLNLVADKTESFSRTYKIYIDDTARVNIAELQYRLIRVDQSIVSVDLRTPATHGYTGKPYLIVTLLIDTDRKLPVESRNMRYVLSKIMRKLIELKIVTYNV